MRARAVVLLAGLRTKVRVGFEVEAEAGLDVRGEETGCPRATPTLNVRVGTTAEVVYGERYKEDKMAEFLSSYVGEKVRNPAEMGVWADAVRELRDRLVARGKKGAVKL
ncbi:hypothetical protein BDY21DRAFT_353710 [Lineolata rhizophorae]|uniref:Uncharacterized protein n=1 Tax=Lineolata rhizophorae TaxID=578093 RepID=A0A6A6NS08_9PEZI|nr:hypothetical protein BDY21DRAFT_353710 [Lineolata rhizophorae]